MAAKKEKKRWTSTQRLERTIKKNTPKPDKLRWKIQLKNVKTMKTDLAKKRKERIANRKKLIEKGVIKQA